MKKRLSAFLAGMLTTALVCGLTVSALATNGLISINAALNNIAIEVNSKPAIAKGENYTTDSGSETAGSILYNETTYVPLRKVAELLGAEIKWDASTGTANIVGQIEAPLRPQRLLTRPLHLGTTQIGHQRKRWRIRSLRDFGAYD